MKKIIFAFMVSVFSISTIQTRAEEKSDKVFPEINKKGKIAIVAHRGYWKCEEAGNSQNSIASLAAAQNNAFWGSECDIHLTADDVIIVNHDDEIDGLKISNHSYSELSSHLLKNGEKRPTFGEYLDQHAKGCLNTMLVVEFKIQADKAHEDLLVEKAIASLKKKGLFDPSGVAFISFSHNICRKIAAEAPGFINQYLEGDIAPSVLAGEGINGIDYHYDVLKEHPEWVKEAHDLGMSVNVWTVNKKEDMKYFIRLGVDAITTNEPVALRKMLHNKEFKK